MDPVFGVILNHYGDPWSQYNYAAVNGALPQQYKEEATIYSQRFHIAVVVVLVAVTAAVVAAAASAAAAAAAAAATAAAAAAGAGDGAGACAAAAACAVAACGGDLEFNWKAYGQRLAMQSLISASAAAPTTQTTAPSSEIAILSFAERLVVFSLFEAMRFAPLWSSHCGPREHHIEPL
jgi:hypothetical protein